ncbi:MAG: TetR/AcrR family transcriptional regulator, partial [Candidatus Hodarchaeota archaeon]
MPYPSQTNAKEIRTTALELLEKYGEDKVTIRGVAKSLGLSPNAIYRYYKDKDALLAELASEGARVLLQRLHEASFGKEDQEAIFSLADSYVEFALRHQSLYELMMRTHQYTPDQEKKFHELWDFVRSRVGLVIANADEAAVAFWGFLHGMIGLEQADVFHKGKPRTGVHTGLEALLAGFKARL